MPMVWPPGMPKTNLTPSALRTSTTARPALSFAISYIHFGARAPELLLFCRIEGSHARAWWLGFNSKYDCRLAVAAVCASAAFGQVDATIVRPTSSPNRFHAHFLPKPSAATGAPERRCPVFAICDNKSHISAQEARTGNA